MFNASRISRVALVALAACLVVGCARARSRPEPGNAGSLAISGVVRDPQGRPIPAVWVEVVGHPDPTSSPPAWRTDANGRFETDVLPPGPKQLLLMPGIYTPDHPTKVVATRAGARDLDIVLDPGPRVFLRIVDYVPGERTRWARATWNDEGPYREIRYAPIGDDGRVCFVAMPLDREIEVWADAEPGVRIVRALGLVPGESERRIEHEPTLEIAGRVRIPKALFERRIEEAKGGPLREYLRVSVYAHAYDLEIAETRVEDDGTFRVPGLPPGSYLVHAHVYGGLFGEGEKQVEAGTTDIVLELDQRAHKK